VRRALPFLILLLAGLAACKPAEDPRAPFTDSRIPPGLEKRFYPPQGWAWGLIRIGTAAPVRYGVAAPAATPTTQVVILPGYGEPAEAWFETARDLIAHGCTVWILEAAGQGGSGRSSMPRDLGHALSLDPDVATLLVFPEVAARDRPLFVLASGESAPVALRAAELGLRADGLILTGPVLRPKGDLGKARRMRRLMLGGLRADGGQPWRRDGPDDVAMGRTSDPARGRLRLAWQTANPDLRMGGPSWAWLGAFADETQAAVAGEQKVRMPVTVLATGAQAGTLICGRMPSCAAVDIGNAARAPHLEPEDERKTWLSALLAALEPKTGALAPAPAAATLDDGQ
jgi:lysophospholipase